MDTIERVPIAVEKIECPGTQRIVGSARHAVSIFGRQGVTLDHLSWRMPGGPFGFASDLGNTMPSEAESADAHPVADRRAIQQDVEEPALSGADDDGAGLLASWV